MACTFSGATMNINDGMDKIHVAADRHSRSETESENGTIHRRGAMFVDGGD